MPELNEADKSGFSWSGCDSMRLLDGLQSVQSIGKLILIFLALAIIFAVGWGLDLAVLSLGRDGGVLVLTDGKSPAATLSEIDIYVTGEDRSQVNMQSFREGLIETNRMQLQGVLTQKPFGMTAEAAGLAIKNGSMATQLRQARPKMNAAYTTLAARYAKQAARLETILAERIKAGDSERALEQRTQGIDSLKTATRGLIKAIAGQVVAQEPEVRKWSDTVIQFDMKAEDKAKEKEAYDRDKTLISEALAVGKAHCLAGQMRGQGVFRSFVAFKAGMLHKMALALVTFDCGGLRKAGYELLLGICWLTRFHPLYAVFMTLVGLGVWSIFGTAVCRMTALQFARGERVGWMRSLRFGRSKWLAAFMAPIIPGIIILLCGLAIGLGSVVVTWIPGVGAVIGALLLPLSVAIGLLITFMAISTGCGIGLMFPAVAVEGSGSFDALSRATSYLRDKRWWFLAYYLVAALYGLICYLFIRFFLFLALVSVNRIAGAVVNTVAKSDRMPFDGKFDLLWPAPHFNHLMPDIPWALLSGMEKVSAGIVWLVVAVAVAYLMAYGISLYFSVSTAIYFILRKKVDAIALDDIWVEEDIEAMINEGIEYLNDETGPADSTPPDGEIAKGDDGPIPLEPDGRKPQPDK